MCVVLSASEILLRRSSVHSRCTTTPTLRASTCSKTLTASRTWCRTCVATSPPFVTLWVRWTPIWASKLHPQLQPGLESHAHVSHMQMRVTADVTTPALFVQSDVVDAVTRSSKLSCCKPSFHVLLMINQSSGMRCCFSFVGMSEQII